MEMLSLQEEVDGGCQGQRLGALAVLVDARGSWLWSAFVAGRPRHLSHLCSSFRFLHDEEQHGQSNILSAVPHQERRSIYQNGQRQLVRSNLLCEAQRFLIPSPRLSYSAGFTGHVA